MAAPRFSTGKLSSRTACAMGCMPPPPAPCSTRARINIGMLTAAPQISEDTVNIAIESISSRLRPIMEASQPLAGSTMALETR